MSTHLIQLSGGRRVDTRKEHAARIALAGLEACADEGARFRQASAAMDAPDLFEPTRPLVRQPGRSRTYREDDPKGWRLMQGLRVAGIVIALGIVGFFIVRGAS